MFNSFGEFLQNVANAVSDPRAPHGLPGLEYQVVSGLTGNEGTEGAYLVPTEFAADLLEKTYSTGQLLARCNRFPMRRRTLKIPVINETSRANGSRFGGLSLAWTAEGDALPASKAKFGERALALHKLSSPRPARAATATVTARPTLHNPRHRRLALLKHGLTR